MSAREEILDRVRRALVDAPEAPAVDRGYRAPATLPEGTASWVDLFAERVEDYRAIVHRCAPGEVEDVLARLLDGPTVVPEGFPWRVPEPVADDDLPALDLDEVAGVVTTARVGIALTGTVVLQHGPGGDGRRAISLVPDHHVCVLREDQVVPGVPDAVAVLDPGVPQTWISGPSATSDIELDRVEGVHGPRRLDVVLVATLAGPGS